MLSQRICGLALGYEGLNDHQQLREDPLLAVLSGVHGMKSWLNKSPRRLSTRRGTAA